MSATPAKSYCLRKLDRNIVLIDFNAHGQEKIIKFPARVFIAFHIRFESAFFVNNRDMRRGCGCGGCLSKIVIAVVIIFVVLYWGYSSLTLEKLGKADDAGMFGFLGERYEDKSPRDLGIEDLTLKEIIEWFIDDPV